LERLALTGIERLLDLYSGVGLFTAFLAEEARHVTAVESFPLAVKDAEVNLESFDNIDLIEGAVEDVLSALGRGYDAALLDPPRAGMDARALKALVKIAPQKIVYVSCDPATLARDAKQFVGAGYRLIDVQPVDMFPQTYHIEAVATFEKSPIQNRQPS
jgi:23S rRNA (uracil1939-C5)-methyltransferase